MFVCHLKQCQHRRRSWWCSWRRATTNPLHPSPFSVHPSPLTLYPSPFTPNMTLSTRHQAALLVVFLAQCYNHSPLHFIPNLNPLTRQGTRGPYA